MKTCTACKRELPPAAFGVRRWRADGTAHLKSWCRACDGAYNRAWNAAHREYHREKDRAWRLANRDWRKRYKLRRALKKHGMKGG